MEWGKGGVMAKGGGACLKQIWKGKAKSISFQTNLPLLMVHHSINRYVIFDTPGQIEVFTWSASGAIISESLVIVICVPPVHSPTFYVLPSVLNILSRPHRFLQ